jgi:DNA-binding CsgD family transcriptional regulator
VSWNSLPETDRTQLANKLTTRQHHVYVLWLAGCSYQRIADYLTISPRTVRTHLKRAQAIHRTIHQEAA